ncbi:MAG: hypothetical protein R8M14_04875 [Ghiorsea sp.]
MVTNTTEPTDLGEKITINEHGILDVPNHPFITISHSENSIWQGVQSVFDAAVDKAYADEKQIHWLVGSSDKPLDVSCIGLNLEASKDNVLSILYSGSLLMRYLEWNEAANLVQESLDSVLQSKMIPQGSELFCDCEKVSPSSFCEAMVEYLDDEAVFDVDAAQYDALAEKFKEEFESATDNTVEITKKALEKARQKLTEAGQFTEEKGEKLKTFLEHDLTRLAQEMSKGAKAKLNPTRLGTGALASMSKLLHKTGVAISGFADKADASLACKSGEITSAGKLVCNHCGNKMNFKKTGRIPPCPKCHKTEFTKGY